jgi:hypothetical protein
MSTAQSKRQDRMLDMEIMYELERYGISILTTVKNVPTHSADVACIILHTNLTF